MREAWKRCLRSIAEISVMRDSSGNWRAFCYKSSYELVACMLFKYTCPFFGVPLSSTLYFVSFFFLYLPRIFLLHFIATKVFQVARVTRGHLYWRRMRLHLHPITCKFLYIPVSRVAHLSTCNAFVMTILSEGINRREWRDRWLRLGCLPTRIANVCFEQPNTLYMVCSLYRSGRWRKLQLVVSTTS